MDDMISQRHLRDGFLKAQGTSAFAIVNPECPIRRDKVTKHLHVRGIQYRTTSDSWLFLPNVISRLNIICVKRPTCISQGFWPPLKPKIKSVFTALYLD